jgi:hypothetical protein
MSVMFEVYYQPPRDLERETRISEAAARWGGRLTFVEEPSETDVSRAICLTFEFENLRLAGEAASYVQKLGEHVESISDYGPD